jgi:cobaltochelatase CobN
MQSFSICMNDGDRLSFLEQLGCPVLQVPVALGSRKAWEGNVAGLPPAEIAMNVALPEIDGRLLGTVAGFKENDQLIEEVQFSVKRLAPDLSQIAYVAEWALRWASLRELPNAESRRARSGRGSMSWAKSRSGKKRSTFFSACCASPAAIGPA